MLSQDLTRSQSELYAAFRAETLESPFARLWARIRQHGRGRVEPLGQLEQVPCADPQARAA